MPQTEEQPTWDMVLSDRATSRRRRRGRPRRRSGFEDATSAQAELDQIRDLLALPDKDDLAAITRVGDVVAAAIAEKKPIPPVDQIRQLLRARVQTLEYPTVEQWLLTWLPTKRRIRRNTYRSYESQVRLYSTRSSSTTQRSAPPARARTPSAGKRSSTSARSARPSGSRCHPQTAPSPWSGPTSASTTGGGPGTCLAE